MALIWIITTGNSDVKLLSDCGWGNLRSKKNEQLKPCHKKFGSLILEDDNLFSLPARVIGTVYGDVWETHKSYFKFPLLERFTKKIQNEGKHPDRIIVLLSNQEKVFLEDSSDSRYDRSEESPYWKDTCCLKPILKHFFNQEFGEGKVQLLFSSLKPQNHTEGLDNWDSTLNLVQKEFEKWELSKDDFLIISHQASTPAISSAVQFVSLAKFGERATFLIGNERDIDLTRFLKGSEYLKGIRKKEAETLLNRYDYLGVEALLKNYFKEDDVKTLIDAAIQWNFANFEEFAKQLIDYSDKDLAAQAEAYLNDPNQYWWEAYEAAYLGVVRLKQGNTVESMFHSFRAVEGLLYKWVVKYHSEKLEDRSSGGKDIVVSRNGDGKPKKTYNAYGKGLYWFFNFCETISEKKNKDIWIFGNSVFDRRNELFHQLEGLKGKDAVFKEWKADTEQDWKDRVKNSLNFVSKQEFRSLEDASLMVKVHQKLERAIANL